MKLVLVSPLTSKAMIFMGNELESRGVTGGEEGFMVWYVPVVVFKKEDIKSERG